MHIEFLVEEPSAEAALNNLAPAILGPDITFQVHPYNGKPDLLAKLPGRLAGYRAWLPADWRIVVLLDADEADCLQLKGRYGRHRPRCWTGHEIGGGRSAIPGAQPVGGPGVGGLVLRRRRGLARGLSAAQIPTWASVRDIATRTPSQAGHGKPWSAKLQRVGYAPGGLAKVATARAVSAHMQPERNRSHSFQVFRQGLLELIR